MGTGKWLLRACTSALLTAVFTCGLLILGVAILAMAPRYVQTNVSIGVQNATLWDVLHHVGQLMSSSIHYLAGLIKTLFPWPFVILLLGLAFLGSKHSVAFLIGLIRLIRKIKLFGAEIELTESDKSQIKAVAADLRAATAQYRRLAQESVEVKVRTFDLDQRFQNFLEKNDPIFFRGRMKTTSNLRCTIHIRDVAVEGYLYQLLNYFPKGDDGAGRAFPERYGIIGRVWRLRAAQVVGKLIPGGPKGKTDEELVLEMVANWGMTEVEARKAFPKKSYACYPLLTDTGRMIGLLYMDSTDEHAFHDEDNDEAMIRKALDALSTWPLLKELEGIVDGLMGDRLDLSDRL